MSRLATSFVLGYHGCALEVATAAINGDLALIHSNEDFDWLGPGAYFWESDPRRALEWAKAKLRNAPDAIPAVIGAVIDLRHCLDLMSREDLDLLRAAHRSFIKMQEKSGLPIPRNRTAKGHRHTDKVLRYLDCAVIRHLHSVLGEQASDEGSIDSFDSVRGLFTEGGPLYKGGGFRSKTHIQIAIRNNACIKGLFWPNPYPGVAAAPPTATPAAASPPD